MKRVAGREFWPPEKYGGGIPPYFPAPARRTKQPARRPSLLTARLVFGARDLAVVVGVALRPVRAQPRILRSILLGQVAVALGIQRTERWRRGIAGAIGTLFVPPFMPLSFMPFDVPPLVGWPAGDSAAAAAAPTSSARTLRLPMSDSPPAAMMLMIFLFMSASICRGESHDPRPASHASCRERATAVPAPKPRGRFPRPVGRVATYTTVAFFHKWEWNTRHGECGADGETGHMRLR